MNYYSILVPTQVFMGLQLRTCIRGPTSVINRWGCQDAAPYTDFIKDFFTRNITSSIPIAENIRNFQLKIKGGVCLCNRDTCNQRLPDSKYTSDGDGVKVSIFLLLSATLLLIFDKFF